MGPDDEGYGLRGGLAEQGFDACERLDQFFLIGLGKLSEFGAGFFMGTPIEERELGLSFGCEREDVLAPVGLSDIPRD